MNDYGTEVRLLAVTGLTEPRLPMPEAYKTPPSEQLIEYASRLCVAKENEIGSRESYIQDRIKAGHESVIEHASATFYIKASRALTHELVRHRIASYSQRSQRFVSESEPRYITPPELKEYKLEEENTGAFFSADSWFRVVMAEAWRNYNKLLRAGVPKEIARYVLPNACETQIIMTMNFRELRHFIKLRTSPRALPEMREVANKVKDICKQIAPAVFGDL